MTLSRAVPAVAAVLGAGLLLTTGCSGAPSRTGPAGAGTVALATFDSCEQAGDALRAAARQHVGPWGFTTGQGAVELDGAQARVDAGDQPAAAAQPAVPEAGAPGAGAPGAGAPDAAAPGEPVDRDGGAGPAHSGTNVHEAGVDEPDLVKTDGRRIVVVSDGVLRVVDPATQSVTGTLPLVDPVPGAAPELPGYGWGQPADLLLSGDRALVLMHHGAARTPMPLVEPDSPVTNDPATNDPATNDPATNDPATGDPVTDDPVTDDAPILGPTLLLVDLSGAPRVVSEYSMDGSLVDARATGATVRVVVRSGPRLNFPGAEPGGTEPAASEQERLAENRAALEAAPLDDWLPRFRVASGGTPQQDTVPCTALHRPAGGPGADEFSGTSMLTVLTFALVGDALGDGKPVTVVADGDTVYSTGDSLYVASDRRWHASDQHDPGTDIYRFDTTGTEAPRYAAAGAVPGWLINQYAMSEWDGHLRVATTTGQQWGEDPDSESAVYVLASRDGELVTVGSVGGLGKTERIYSVRFTGPVGYVVTFRETDPLYTLDLSNPAAPAVLGELKITGYSSYLHPLGSGRLIGVGQEADLQGRIEGTHVSMFDVSDLSHPVLHAQHHIPSGHSEAEADPHAFLWWPDQQLLVIPLQTVADHRHHTGVLLLRVEDDGFTELEQLAHPAPEGGEHPAPATPIRRSLVVEDTLWTVSAAGMQANALSTFEEVAWIPFR